MQTDWNIHVFRIVYYKNISADDSSLSSKSSTVLILAPSTRDKQWSGHVFSTNLLGLKEERIPKYLQPIVNQNQAQAQNQQVNVIVHQPQPSIALREMYGYGRLSENHLYDRD